MAMRRYSGRAGPEPPIVPGYSAGSMCNHGSWAGDNREHGSGRYAHTVLRRSHPVDPGHHPARITDAGEAVSPLTGRARGATVDRCAAIIAAPVRLRACDADAGRAVVDRARFFSAS